jgi:hypothetical protein
MTSTRSVEIAYFQGSPISILERGATLTRIIDGRGHEFSVRNEQIKIKKVRTSLPA